MASVLWLVVAAILLLCGGCAQIDTLLYQPATTPQQWCDGMPCVPFFSTGLILNQPSSSALVYFLGFVWLWAGWRFWRTDYSDTSTRWWAAAMVLGGIAALSAGTSYQAFPYELKCAGRALCTWTSGWEIAYLLIQICSMNVMLIAVAHSCTAGALRRRLIVFAYLNTAIYFGAIAVGAYLPSRFMLSFELLVLFSAPAFFLYFYINGLGYLRHRSIKDGVLLGAWILMILTNAGYYAYSMLGYTELLWARGYWFSDNDLLHVLMLLWVIYMGTAVVRVVVRPTAANRS